jgi:bifunctional DNA-binding transcriptional regulator/antitoxin component of YhaV-PrlF toxin-antitoxin module
LLYLVRFGKVSGRRLAVRKKRPTYDANPRPVERDEFDAYVEMLLEDRPPVVVRVSGKNQITLPVAAMKRLGIEKGDELSVTVLPGSIRLEPRPRTAQEWAERLQGSMAHVAEWSSGERIDEWIRGERDSWNRGWDEDDRPS